MSDAATKIHIASNLLRSPHLFDGLVPLDESSQDKDRPKRRKSGACTGGILRDLVLFAAWKNERVCELRLPDFCKMMGYDSSNLTRRCSNDEVEEIRRAGWPEEYIEAFSNVLGLALVRLVSHNFIQTTKTANATRIGGAKIIEHVDVYEAKSTGTLLSFTLSTSILGQNRREFQTPILEEYLSLRTQSATRQEGHPGHPDDAARRMYLRLTWLRQYYDYLMRENRSSDARNLLRDKYHELVLVAGLAERRNYWPEKRVAAELRKLLLRVASMASINLVPQVKGKDSVYEVTWEPQELVVPAEVVDPYPCAPAPAAWGTAPAPGAPRPARRAKPTAPASVKSTPIKPVKRPQPAAPKVNRQKLLDQLEDATKQLRWFDTPAAGQANAYVENPELLGQHREQALAAVKSIKHQLGLS